MWSFDCVLPNCALTFALLDEMKKHLVLIPLSGLLWIYNTNTINIERSSQHRHEPNHTISCGTKNKNIKSCWSWSPRISGSNGTLAVSRGHVELRDVAGHRLRRQPPDRPLVAPSVGYTLRAAARAVLGGDEKVGPEEALKDLELVPQMVWHVLLFF